MSCREAIINLRKQAEGYAEKKGLIDAEFRQFSEQKMEYTRLTERQVSLVRETDGLARQRDLTKAKLTELAQQEQEFSGLEQRVSSYPEKKQAFEVLRNRKRDFEHLKTEAEFAGRDCADLRNRAEKIHAKITVLDEDKARMASLVAGIKKTLSIAADVPVNDLEQLIASREAAVLHATGTCSSRLNHLSEERNKLLADYEVIKNAGADGVCPLCH